MGSSIAFAAALAALAAQIIARRAFALLLSLALLASPGVAAQPKAPQLFEPESKWTVDFDDQRCFAARRFRSDSQGLVLGISPWPMFKWAKIVIEKPGRAEGIVPLNGKIRIDGGEAFSEMMYAADSANNGRVIYTFTLSGEAFGALKAGRRLHVQATQLNADIPLTSLTPVIAKLGECLPMLLEHWGFPKDKQAMVASYPDHARPMPFSTSDYPASALRRGAVGVVEVLLNVGVDGKALDCKIIRSSGHKDLDDVTCEKIMRRGKFEPGRDRTGKAIVSPFYFNVNWLIPG